MMQRLQFLTNLSFPVSSLSFCYCHCISKIANAFFNCITKIKAIRLSQLKLTCLNLFMNWIFDYVVVSVDLLMNTLINLIKKVCHSNEKFLAADFTMRTGISIKRASWWGYKWRFIWILYLVFFKLKEWNFLFHVQFFMDFVLTWIFL